MLHDFRFAFRILVSRPVFTIVAALSLALGIGANSTIFSLIDTLWFRPLAVSQPSQIVRIFSLTDQEKEGGLSYPEYLDIKQQANLLSDVVAIGGRGATLLDGDRRDLLGLNLVSSNFFTALGVKPAVGRLFTPEDEFDSPGSLVVVLGNSFWQRRFGGDPGIVGKQIRIQRVKDVLATVIGILPKSFRQIDAGSDRDLWFPRQTWSTLGNEEELQTRGSRWFRVLGRLATGAGVGSANSQVEAIATRMAEAWPASNKGRRARVVTDLRYRLTQAGTNGLALLAIVMLVVLISSVNVANLLLSRAGVRGREMAIRLALGADRKRLIRQLMTENLVLGAVGLLLGLFIGSWLIATLPSLVVQPPGFHEAILDFQFDIRVLAFSILISGATVLLFGLAPAWRATRPDLVPALKGDAAFQPAGRRWPLRNWLVVAQIAVSMALLTCAGVLVRSFANTRTADLGFGRKQLLLVWVSADAKSSLYREVISRFQGLPGVRSVAAAVRAPLSLSSNGMFQRVTFPGRPEFANTPPFEIKYNSVTPNLLPTMGTPIVRGRGFDSSDETPASDALIVNEQMAQRFWPSGDPIGKTIRIGGAKGKTCQIVGVAKNAPINAVGETPEPYLYLPYWANFEQEVTFMIEASSDAAALAQAARLALKSVDSRLDPLTITTQNDLIRYSAQRYQITAELVSVLGFLGLLLTAVGLYGVVSYGVSQRTRELGIRMALGADRGDTLALVMREVATLGLFGIGGGLPIAMVATRLFSTLLFGVGPWDPLTFTVAVVLLATILLLAGFLPARRATGIEPSSALRVV